MAKKLAIPAPGDLVLCIKSGWGGIRDSESDICYIQKDNMGVVTKTYSSSYYGIDTVTIKWLNCDTTRFNMNDKADLVSGWKKWIRVAQ